MVIPFHRGDVDQEKQKKKEEKRKPRDVWPCPSPSPQDVRGHSPPASHDSFPAPAVVVKKKENLLRSVIVMLEGDVVVGR